jgi:hypothetical protein
MSRPLSETRIVEDLAEQATQALTRQVISYFQRLTGINIFNPAAACARCDLAADPRGRSVAL